MSQCEHGSGGCLGRRRFLAMSAVVPSISGSLLSYTSAQEPKAAAGKSDPNSKWGVPGPYPGRVIEVREPRMIKNDVKNREAIHQAVGRGMKELTGATDRGRSVEELSSSPAMSSASR